MSISDLDDSCHILILADFSGREHRGLNDTDSIKQRKIVQVDRDNFEKVFKDFDVKCNLPLAEETLLFGELEDMHPDVIYEKVPLFDRLRALKRKLKAPATFASAADEIYQWYEDSPDANPSSIKTQEVEPTDDSSLLDNILSSSASALPSSQFDVQALIRDIVSPYVSPKPDPRLDELLQTVDDATSHLMRKIMHAQAFQNIESAWRGLQLIVKRLETDRNTKLFIADISQQELIDDSAVNFEQSNLYHLLVSDRTSIGNVPFKVMMHADSFGHSVSDVKSLNHLGRIAESCGAVAIIGITEQIAGCESLEKTPDCDDWNFAQDPDLIKFWNILRTQSHANHLVAVTPRFLCRMPYGKKSASIESFNYEELPTVDRHLYYLWSSGAWLATLLVAQNYSPITSIVSLRTNQIDSLPLHVFYEDDEARITPCAEICMLDPTSLALGKFGLTSIRSILNKDSIVIPNLKVIKA